MPNPIVQGLTHMITHSSYRLVLVDSADAIRHSMPIMPIQTLGAGRNPHPGIKDEMKRHVCYSTSWRLYLRFATNIHKTKGRLGTSWNLGTSNSYSSCLFQVFRHMCKGFRADLRKLRPVTSLHHFRCMQQGASIACSRKS